MYSFYEGVRAALLSIRAHGLRSFLTTLGIIIGVASVIAVVSVVQGLSFSIGDKFKGLGSNSLTVRSETTFQDQLQGKVNILTMRDFRSIQEHIDDIRNVTPSFAPFGLYGTTVSNGSRSAFTRVTAVTPLYANARQNFPQLGRFITHGDEESRRRICVIGTQLRDNLGLPADPIGHFIEIESEWFKIVGVMETRGEMFGLSQDDYVLIPFSVGMSLSPDISQQDVGITFDVNNVEQIDEIQGRVTALLRQRHQLRPDQGNDFKVQTAQQLKESFSGILDSLTLVLGGIVGVSLLVSGIGIMNIMLVSVTERTREIGICKALGAQRHHILTQFLIEATTLSMLGGLVGVVVGYGLGYLVAIMIPGFPSAVIPLWAVLLAFGFSTLIGIVFGIMPALKAASLDPIVALRYE